jgi:hypothetical protein
VGLVVLDGRAQLLCLFDARWRSMSCCEGVGRRSIYIIGRLITLVYIQIRIFEPNQVLRGAIG